MANRFDYIVVGAGAAGCVVAGRLSEQKHLRIALIEAGGSDWNPLLRLPGTGFLVGADPRYNWNFQTDPIPTLEGRQLTWLQGKVLGGSSSINGMIYTHGHSREYDIWRQMGCVGWGFEDVLPYFRKSEGNERGESRWHGGDGPLKVKRSDPRLPIAEAFLDAAREDGFPVVDDLNCDASDAFGYYDVNIDRGLRMSTAAAYIRADNNRPNLTVFTNAAARRIIFSGSRATAVEIERVGRLETLTADREIILSCGAVKSPQLLLLSGIGPADDLRDLGIPVLVDAPRVGRNLQNHPCYRPQYSCLAPVTAKRHLAPTRLAKALYSYATKRSGPLAESFVTAGGFFRTNASLEIPDIQVVLLAALMPREMSGSPRPWKMLPREEGFTLSIYQGTPNSRGEVRLRSRDPAEQPRIVSGYFDDPRDIQVLMDGVERMRQMMAMPSISRFIRQELQPGPAVLTRTDLEAEIRRNVATSHHQSGTCAMGDRDDSVTDPQLRVRGVTGLRIADASIIPRLPNAALHGPIVMIGEKASAMILADTQA